MENKIEWFTGSPQYRELDRVDGEQMEFERKIFAGFTTLQILVEIQQVMIEMQCEPGQLKGRIIFMSMYNDTVWGQTKETKTDALRIPEPWQDLQKDSHKDIGRFLGLDQKRNGADQTRTSRMENRMMSLNTCCSTIAKADIPYSSDIGLVRRACSADLRTYVFQYGETHGEYDWRVGVSNLTQCRVNLTEPTFEQCSGTGRLVAKT